MTEIARRHHVVVIGSGFGGLFAAKRLKRAGVDVTPLRFTRTSRLAGNGLESLRPASVLSPGRPLASCFASAALTWRTDATRASAVNLSFKALIWPSVAFSPR